MILFMQERSTASKHENEMQTLQRAFNSFKWEQEKVSSICLYFKIGKHQKEKLAEDKMNSLLDRNTELIGEKNILEARCNELLYVICLFIYFTILLIFNAFFCHEGRKIYRPKTASPKSTPNARSYPLKFTIRKRRL